MGDEEEIDKKPLHEFYPDELRRIYESRNARMHRFRALYSDTPQPKDNRSARQRIDDRRKELENVGFEQDIKLKKTTLRNLFIFLAVETGLVFAIAFFQGFKLGGFYIEEWSFRLVVTATITQITIMLKVAVNHLFPKK